MSCTSTGAIPTVFSNTTFPSAAVHDKEDFHEYLSIRSSDMYEFIVPLEWMTISQTIRNMVRGSGDFKENKSVIRLPGKEIV